MQACDQQHFAGGIGAQLFQLGRSGPIHADRFGFNLLHLGELVGLLGRGSPCTAATMGILAYLIWRREHGGTVHLNSELLFKEYGLDYVRGQARVLEIGPDGFPSTYQTAVGDSSIQWDTVDLHSHEKLTYRAVAEYSFPIPDESYDIVLSGQVMEHVRKPWIWIKELARVCHAGGKVITINPVSWPFHEYPVDCWRAYAEGMKALYEDANLKVLLSVSESLEKPRFKRRIPGRSLAQLRRRLRAAYTVLGTFGFPVEQAVDTITVGEKA